MIPAPAEQNFCSAGAKITKFIYISSSQGSFFAFFACKKEDMRGVTTIKDISKALNISVSTVSRALRDTFDVSRETREKVLAKAEELNYKPNLNAINLSTGKTYTIGVLIPLITNYYFSTVLTGIQEVAYKKGYKVVIYITQDSADEEIMILKNAPIGALDGLIVSSSSNNFSLRYLKEIKNKYKKPIVFFDRAVDRLNVSKVLQDDYYGAVTAVEHLIKAGYKKIAHITGPAELDLTRRRKSGYLDTLKRNGIPIREEWIVHSKFSEESGILDTNALFGLKETPDAIFAVNDRKAIGAMKFLKENGIQIGKDVGVIGFTNSPFSSAITPSLSTISEPALEMGIKSAGLLLEHLLSKNATPKRIILPCKLIARESTKRY